MKSAHSTQSIGPCSTFIAACSLWASTATAQVVINEVDYDQPSTDTAEFVELFNSGDDPVDLGDHELRFINGANGTQYESVELPSVVLAPGAFYVVCGIATNVDNCDLDDADDDDNFIQNGAPDAIGLFVAGELADAISYEGEVPGFFEGAAAPTDTASEGESLSRCPDGADTDRNDIDFLLRPASPGGENLCPGDGPEVGECGDAATPIHDIQGAGSSSPLVGSAVVIEGVVVGDFQNAQIDGFFVQEEDTEADGDAATSEGIFVYEAGSPVELATGEVVRVAGEVAEFSSLTELTNVTVLSCGLSATASATDLSFPLAESDELESLEGMLVEIPETMTVTDNFELGRFGSLGLSSGGRLLQPTQVAAPGPDALAVAELNDRRRIVLDDASTEQNPDPIPYKDAANTRRVGDTVTGLTGILSGRFGSYRIQPTEPVTFASSNPRPQQPEQVGGLVEVASLNVLNFFTTLDDGQPACGPDGTLGCRGADSAAELDRQRVKILNALERMDADVVGLIEIENNASAASESLVDGLNDRLGAGTYSFVDTGTIGTDAIKVAFIYKPGVVSPVGDFAVLDSAVDPRFLDQKNRPALAQTFAANENGARFTVVNNHFKSKGSDCEDVGDPDLGDGQGNCNQTRALAAEALVDWLATDPTQSGTREFLIIGDLNAYAMEDPIDVLKAAGYHALIEEFIGDEASSFVFFGASGYLDHALASPTLAAKVTSVVEWHINGDEPVVLDYNTEFKTDDPYSGDDPFRASDHDPLIVGLDLQPALPMCLGQLATIYVEDGSIVGGPDDGEPYAGALRGTQGGDVIVGTPAADSVRARGGDDIVCAGGGNDDVRGQGGDDVIFGEAGHDAVRGGAGDDTVSGGAGDDDLRGQAGEDHLFGDQGDDELRGQAGDDRLFGGDGDDRLRGGGGDDQMIGGQDEDECRGQGGDDQADSCEVTVGVP